MLKLAELAWCLLCLLLSNGQRSAQHQQQQQEQHKNMAVFECNIYNDYYRGEPLYAGTASAFRDPHLHDVSTLRLANFLNDNSTSTKTTTSTNNNDHFKWRLIRVENEKNVFMVQNVKSGEYLFVTNRMLGPKRRQVFSKKLPIMRSQQGDASTAMRIIHVGMLWTLRQPYSSQDGDDHEDEYSRSSCLIGSQSMLRVSVWSVRYGEAMYAPGLFVGGGLFSRRVFTWYDEPDSTAFNWLVKCNNNILPVL